VSSRKPTTRARDPRRPAASMIRRRRLPVWPDALVGRAHDRGRRPVRRRHSERLPDRRRRHAHSDGSGLRDDAHDRWQPRRVGTGRPGHVVLHARPAAGRAVADPRWRQRTVAAGQAEGRRSFPTRRSPATDPSARRAQGDLRWRGFGRGVLRVLPPVVRIAARAGQAVLAVVLLPDECPAWCVG
jgi:hypothetical protein